jgi:predicted DNA-binding transcriptional regulator YafY
MPLNFWQNSVTAEPVTMQINKEVLSDVEEWLGIENVSKVNDKFIATASLPYDSGLISKIISYGNNVKILEPKKLKEDIKKKAQEIVICYE